MKKYLFFTIDGDMKEQTITRKISKTNVDETLNLIFTGPNGPEKSSVAKASIKIYTHNSVKYLYFSSIPNNKTEEENLAKIPFINDKIYGEFGLFKLKDDSEDENFYHIQSLNLKSFLKIISKNSPSIGSTPINSEILDYSSDDFILD